jgi:dihydrofolate synthase / folylpolyglutamate synthase
MEVRPIKTRKLLPPKDSLSDLLAAIPKLKDQSIVAISSKVVSICEGNTIPIAEIAHEKLVEKLSSATLEPVKRGANGMILTQVGNVLVESAGIDLSNANGYYVLLPKNPYKSAQKIWSFLRKRDRIKSLGVVITDSHSVPRRKGAEGYALATYGFRGSYVYPDKHDLFGRKSRVAAIDVADGLAAAAVLAMGEGSEHTPLAIITDFTRINFFTKTIPLSTVRRYAWVHPDLDVYSPLLRSSLWHRVKKDR